MDKISGTKLASSSKSRHSITQLPMFNLRALANKRFVLVVYLIM